MKMFSNKKVKTILLSCLTFFATAFCAAVATAAPVKANADTLASTVYQTDGASVRVFKWNGSAYEATDRQGIRFHVETGANYEIATDTLLLNTAETNDNGSYKMAEGYKSYTLVIPTRLMSGSADLTMTLDKVMKIDTTEYWFTDKDGNWESVAYIYNIPEKWYTDEFTYRGVIVSVDAEGNETPVKWTPMQTRVFAWVAKQAYNDTIDANSNYWGTAERDDAAAPMIKAFIPTYNITYANGTMEEVLWGDKLTKADANQTYYDEQNHEPIDVTKPLEMSTSCNITLETTEESAFVLTGVEYTAAGFNVYATLPTSDAFKNDISLEPSTVDMVTGAGNKVTANSVTVHVVGSGADARSQLKIGFDYTNISNGTTLTILKTSHFYNKGVLYELEKDYEFVYNNNTWELPLGYITLGDIESIVNFSENGSSGKEENIRINFRKDILINGSATFDSGAVTITRTNSSVETISDGYYYWNQGGAKILEIPGEDGGNIWGEKNGDVLTIPAGTRLIQNGGFYIFQNEIRATFNGGEQWVFTSELHEIDASAFTAAYTRQNGDDIYIDVHTSKAWVDYYVKAVCNDGTLTYHNTDNVTTVDPNEIYYHGENGNKILRIHLDRYSVTGDWVTIPANTEFWVGDQIYKLTEDVISYFVDTGSNGMSWVTNPVINDVSLSNITNMGWHQSNIRYTTDVSWSTAANNRVIVDDTYIDEEGVVVTGSNYSGFYYYGGSNRLLELQGLNFSEIGGSATIKKGVILWLFDNTGHVYTGAYRLTEDFTIEVSGQAGSPMYKDVEVASINKNDIVHIYNDGSHSGEIRFGLNGVKVTGMYGEAEVEGSATLNDAATTSAFVYGGDGTSGYQGNTIIAFTGKNFGKAFQATAVGDVVKIAAGTKVWLSNMTGYVMIEDDWSYEWNGSNYVNNIAQYTVTFSGNATVKVDNTAVTSYTADYGTKITFTVAAPAGFSVLGVSNAEANGDGTYSVVIDGDKTLDVQLCIELGKSAITAVNAYDETQHGEDLTGVRMSIDGNSSFKNITSVHYGLQWTGSVTATVSGGVYYATAFGGHNLFELRFATANLKNGDEFKIAAGTVFTGGGSGGVPYAIKWTEDIVGTYVANSWVLNNTDMGLLDWNAVGIEQIYSYSDYVNEQPINYTIRINLNNALFGGATEQGGAVGITIDGNDYTGVCRYHGGSNKIFEISQWSYAKDQVLVIKAGTKILIGSMYYVTTNTLTATCQNDGHAAQWKFTIS